MIIVATLLGSAFVTSALSAVLGMAGGMVLMGVLPLVLSVQAALIAHGVIQFFSNAFRAWFLRGHIRRDITVECVGGSLVAVAVASSVVFVPNRATVYLTLGVLPFLKWLQLPMATLGIEKRGRPFMSGFGVMCVQMFAGASGPLLDVFYTESRFGKREIVATKAAVQAVSHLMKSCYFALIPWLARGVSRPT